MRAGGNGLDAGDSAAVVYARSVVTAHTLDNVPTQRSPATPSTVMPHLALGFPPRAPP